MTWTLFLDDERKPNWNLEGEVLVAKSAEEARQLIADRGVPSVISFDHDLGAFESGIHFLWWLIDESLEDRLDLMKVECVVVHSMNPVGALNIAKLWDGYAADLGSEVRAHIQPYRYSW